MLPAEVRDDAAADGVVAAASALLLLSSMLLPLLLLLLLLLARLLLLLPTVLLLLLGCAGAAAEALPMKMDAWWLVLTELDGRYCSAKRLAAQKDSQCTAPTAQLNSAAAANPEYILATS